MTYDEYLKQHGDTDDGTPHNVGGKKSPDQIRKEEEEAWQRHALGVAPAPDLRIWDDPETGRSRTVTKTEYVELEQAWRKKLADMERRRIEQQRMQEKAELKRKEKVHVAGKVVVWEDGSKNYISETGEVSPRILKATDEYDSAGYPKARRGDPKPRLETAIEKIKTEDGRVIHAVVVYEHMIDGRVIRHSPKNEAKATQVVPAPPEPEPDPETPVFDLLKEHEDLLTPVEKEIMEQVQVIEKKRFSLSPKMKSDMIQISKVVAVSGGFSLVALIIALLFLL